MANTALPQSSLAVTGDTFRYYQRHGWQELELKSSCNYSTNHMASGVYIHTHIQDT